MALIRAEVPFYEDLVMAVYDDQTQSISVVCKRVAENLGLSWSSQYAVLRGHAWLKDELLNVDINIQGQTYETTCLPLRYLPYWLSGIQANRVKPAIRAKLVHYQRECADVLARYFLGDGAPINPDEPVRSTLDVIEGMVKELRRQEAITKEIPLLVQTVESHSQAIDALQAWKAAEEKRQAQRKWHAERDFPDWIKQWVWKEMDGRCMKCRCPLYPEAPKGAPDRPQYDHIIPKNCGGLGTIDNCQLTCSTCNPSKGGCRGGRHNHSDYRPADLRYKAEQLAGDRERQAQLEKEQQEKQMRFLFEDLGMQG